MAARRLIAVLIVLLVISSFAAALAPREEGSETSTTSTPPTAQAAPVGAIVQENVRANPAEPVIVEAEVGDQLQLEVAVSGPSSVQIPGLDRQDFATETAPARFEFLLRRTGRFAVTVGEDEPETVARLVISEPA